MNNGFVAWKDKTLKRNSIKMFAEKFGEKSLEISANKTLIEKKN